MHPAAVLAVLTVLHIAATLTSALDSSPEYDWFEKHVARKCFAPKDAVWSLDEGAKETVLSRKTEYFGAFEQAEGFFYHYSTTIQQTEYAVKNGIRVKPGTTHKHSRVYRCQYGVRRSTRAALGICYPSDAMGVPKVSGDKPWPFTVYVTSLRLLSNSSMMQTYDTLPPYEDLFAATSAGVRPGRQETLMTFNRNAQAKVAISTTIKAFDVDPITLEQRYMGAQSPAMEHEVPCG